MFSLKKFLKITLAAAVVGIGAALLWTQYQTHSMNKTAAEAVNTEAPEITAVAQDGTEVKLSALRGQTVFVNFWATWCGPCMEEMPEMNKIYPDYKDKIVFLAVSIDDAKADYEAYAAKSGYNYPLYFGSKNDIVTAYGLQGIPASYIIDKHGTITKSHIGGMKEQDLRAFLDSAL